MRTNAAIADPEIEYPPLAQDALGNRLPIPDGTCAWRICRETEGRPREIKGPDKKPARFALTTTIEELVDLCGRDVYRIYALDDVGEDLGHVTTINAERERELRNAGGEVDFAAVRMTPTGSTSDLRFALEALTQIARINGEALRSVSQAQADWVKAIAMAKGLPRNVAFPSPRDDDDDDDEDDDEPEAPVVAAPTAEPTSGVDAFLKAVSPMLPGLYEEWRGKSKADGATAMTHLARIQAQLSGKEKLFLQTLLTDAAHGDEIATWFASQTVEEVVGRIRAETAKAVATNDDTGVSRPAAPPVVAPAELDKQFKDKAMAIAAHLDASEQLRLVRIAPQLKARTADPEVRRIVDTLMPMPVEHAAKWIREHLVELEKRFAS